MPQMSAGVIVVLVDQKVGIARADLLDPEAVLGWPRQGYGRIEI